MGMAPFLQKNGRIGNSPNRVSDTFPFPFQPSAGIGVMEGACRLQKRKRHSSGNRRKRFWGNAAVMMGMPDRTQSGNLRHIDWFRRMDCMESVVQNEQKIQREKSIILINTFVHGSRLVRNVGLSLSNLRKNRERHSCLSGSGANVQ